jgi:hypothetical protein
VSLGLDLGSIDLGSAFLHKNRDPECKEPGSSNTEIYVENIEEL